MGRRQPFSVQIRNGIYYVQLWNETTGKYTSARSTEAKNKDEARDIAREWVKNGIPDARTDSTKRSVHDVLAIDSIVTAIRSPSFLESDAQVILTALKERGFIESAFTKNSPSSEPVTDFLKRAWSVDGPYVSERRAYKHSIGLRHLQTAESAISVHWEPAFRGKRLGDIRRLDLKRFAMELASSGLAPKSVNKIMSFGTAVLRWAADNGLIPEDPTKGVPRFANIQSKQRGILKQEELRSLFTLPASVWTVEPTKGHFAPPEQREQTAFIIAATTGMRLGEIAALRESDIDSDRIHINHSWSEADHLKSPKNGCIREVPILPEVYSAICSLLKTNPYKNIGCRFLFWGRYEDRPVDSKILSIGFNRALAAIGITDERRLERGLSFHSLRHGFARAMSDRLSSEVAQTATGHLDVEMLKHYSDHESEDAFRKIQLATLDAFSSILEIKKSA